MKEKLVKTSSAIACTLFEQLTKIYCKCKITRMKMIHKVHSRNTFGQWVITSTVSFVVCIFNLCFTINVFLVLTLTLKISSGTIMPSRSRSRSRSRSGGRSRERKHSGGRRDHSRSPMSNRRRHEGNRDDAAPSKCVGVFGLSLYTNERELEAEFKKFGPLEKVQVVLDGHTGRSRGFAFIYFENMVSGHLVIPVILL